MRDDHDQPTGSPDELEGVDTTDAEEEVTQTHPEDSDPLTLDGDFDAEDYATGDN